MAVYVSGTVLASLFYDHSVSICDQIGFLFGDVVSHVTDTISDSQMNNSEVETRIYVYDSVPCTPDRKVFDSRGNIVEASVLELLKGKQKSVVGWYSFRRSSAMRPSFRERLIHENLSHRVSNDHPTDFIFLLCTSKFTANLSTHSFDHGFMKITNNVFKKVPLTVVNLGDTTHTEYRQIPSHTVSHSRGIYNAIVKQHEQDFLNSHGQVEINRITALSNTLHKQLEHISKDVAESETELSALENEVQRHRKQVKLKQLEQRQREAALAQSSTSAANQKSVIHEEMEHSDLHKSKQPSIDDILSMEDVDSEPVTLNHAVPTFDLSDIGLLSQSSETEINDKQQDTSQTSSESDIEFPKTKQEVKLTAAISLHDKSEKKSNPSVPISKSEQSTSKGATSEKSSDPFSFVSSIIKESKTEDTSNVRSRSTMEVPKGEEIKRPLMKNKGLANNSGTQEKTVKVTRSKSDRESVAAMAAASAIERSRSTRSQTKVQGQKGKLPDGSNSKVENDFNDDVEMKKTKTRTNDATKHCGQEAEEEKSQSSQDTYDMDVSSSPVY